MEFAAFFPAWLDAFLIAPFRWPGSPFPGLWLGSAFLSAYCVVLGELTGAALFFLFHRYYNGMQDNMLRYHNLSVEALHAGKKDVYLAANKLAQEGFGKYFFAQASISISTIWPVPFALGWAALRFEGIDMYSIPGTERNAGYVFVFLSLYILLRLFFSRIKKSLPLFRHVAALKEQAQKTRGAARSFFYSQRK